MTGVDGPSSDSRSAIGSLVWVNGESTAGAGAAVSAHDRGFTLGDGVFETMRLRHGTLFRLAQHRARLRQGLAVLEIREPATLDGWIDQAARTAAAAANAAGVGELGMRVTVTRGAGVAGLTPPAEQTPTVVVTASPMPVAASHVHGRGIRALVARGRRNELAMTAGVKTTAYADAVLALLEARRAGAEEAIFLDTRGYCSEATASNLFVLTHGRLVTPDLSCGALPGITRAVLIELGRELDVPVTEEAFGVDVLFSAAEAFLTSSLRGIAPLVSVDGRPVGTGRPGPMTQQLMEGYARLVERECRGASHA